MEATMLNIMPIRRPGWTPLPYKGCHNVSVQALIKQPNLALALLKFDPQATIHEHPAPFNIDVICLEGAGFVSVGSEESPLKAGEWVQWPANQPHCLWTTENTMLTLMVEHTPD